jgi:hypothetical protein
VSSCCRGAANADGMIGSVACGASPVVVDGFGGSESTAGGQCHMVSMYQTCSNETADGVSYKFESLIYMHSVFRYPVHCDNTALLLNRRIALVVL